MTTLDKVQAELDSYYPEMPPKFLIQRYYDLLDIKNECEHEPEYIDQSYKLPDILRCKKCKELL